jgi:formate dehydrogenase iron-sulfur subunit
MTVLLIMDPKKCIGCRACEVACESLHNGISNITVYTVEDSLVNVPLTCMHCKDAQCINICPVGAMKRDEDGAVYVDSLQCIGCGMCTIACPFEIPMLYSELKVAVKCDLCMDRRKAGLKPACATVCPADAITYRKIEDVAAQKREATVTKRAAPLAKK